MRADLHLHTTASDGKLEPEQLVSLAVHIGLDAIAITDHDTLDGIVPAITAAKSFPRFIVIPGVEISTFRREGEIHILGYFIDYTDTQLLTVLQKLRDSRNTRAIKMVAKLKELGMEIQWESVQKIARGGSVGRPHVAQALIDAGYIAEFQEAFEKYIGRDKPAYVEWEKVLPEEAVAMIGQAGGLPVLAHPTYIGNVNLEKLLNDLKKVGLVGIEVYYGKYTKKEIDILVKIARDYRLVTTGGSDYHAFGDGVEAMIGEALIPPDSLQQLFSLANEHNLQLIRQGK